MIYKNIEAVDGYGWKYTCTCIAKYFLKRINFSGNQGIWRNGKTEYNVKHTFAISKLWTGLCDKPSVLCGICLW